MPSSFLCRSTPCSLSATPQAVELDEQYRLRIQRQHLRSYFYGEPPVPAELRNLPGKTMALEAPLHPYSFVIGWDDLEIYRVGTGGVQDSSVDEDSLIP